MITFSTFNARIFKFPQKY